jgi:uncharacterized membrane protein HdeD (DUF308 family)
MMTVFGIAVLILGILAIMAPMAAGIATSSLVAILLIVAGIVRIVWAFKAGSFGKGVLAFLIGGVSVFSGILVLARPLLGLASLTLLLAAYFVVEGIFAILAAFKIKPAAGWGWMLFDGIITLLLGGMIWSEWPLSGAWAVGILVGVRLIFGGWSMIFLGSQLRRVGDAPA